MLHFAVAALVVVVQWVVVQKWTVTFVHQEMERCGLEQIYSEVDVVIVVVEMVTEVETVVVVVVIVVVVVSVVVVVVSSVVVVAVVPSVVVVVAAIGVVLKGCWLDSFGLQVSWP